MGYDDAAADAVRQELRGMGATMRGFRTEPCAVKISNRK